MTEKTIREQFPILKRKINGKKLVYLDNSATTQKPESVIKALDEFYRKHNANIHRGLHTLSVEATELYENAHKKVAEFINATSMEEIIFTRGTTESLNLVANAWGRRFLNKGDVVVISEMEHHSNIIPWQMLRNSIGIELAWIPVTEEGELDMDIFKQILSTYRGRVKAVSIAHISNSLGTINPVKEIAQLAHEAGAIFIVDAAQSAARIQLDVQKLDVDFLAFSSHKMYGPTGIGVLYGKKRLLEQMDPWMGGGDMIRRVTVDEFEVADLPWKFEAGTPNIADGAVFSEAIDFINKVGFDWITKHEQNLMEYALKKLQALDWVKVYGPRSAAKRMGAISFFVKGVHPHDLASLLNEDGIAIRAGHHCAMPLHIKLGTPATARASFAVYNTKADVDALIKSIKNAREKFV